MSHPLSWLALVVGLLPWLTAVPIRAAEPPHPDEPVEEILVTMSPITSSSDELAVPVNLLDRDHLIAHLGTTIGETLRNEPGITSSGFAPGASRPVIRGQDTFRVRILEDGMGTADVSAISADHGVPVNPLSAQQVEVVRGPATLRYGGGAIAGAVNVLTNRVPRSQGDTPLSGEVFAGYGSVAEQADFAAQLGGSAGPLAWHVDGLSRRSDDYGLPGTSDVQDNTDTKLWSAAGGTALFGDAGRVGLSFRYFDSDYGVTEPEDPAEAPTIELESGAVDLEGDWFVDLGPFSELRLRGRYTDYAHDEKVQGEAVSKFRADTWEGRLEANQDTWLGATGAVGLHFLVRDFDARGEGEELLAPSDTDMIAGYVFEEVMLSDRVDLQFGARVEATRVEGTPESGRDRDRSFLPLSGAIGGLVDVGAGLDVGLTLSGSQRAPDALELFARGPHEADGTYQLGDPNADEETSWTAELLLRGGFGPVSFDANVFGTYYDGYIFGRLTGNTRDEDGNVFPDDSGDLRELVYSQEDAYFLGFELSGQAPLLELLEGEVGLDAQVDWVRAELDGGEEVPRIPPLRWGAGIYFAGERVRARFGFVRNEAQQRTAEFETRTGGYTMLDASTSVRIFGDEERAIRLEVAIDNLGDVKARNAVSFKKDEQRLPGRSARIALRGTF